MADFLLVVYGKSVTYISEAEADFVGADFFGSWLEMKVFESHVIVISVVFSAFFRGKEGTKTAITSYLYST